MRLIATVANRVNRVPPAKGGHQQRDTEVTHIRWVCIDDRPKEVSVRSKRLDDMPVRVLAT
jgi:hypothetical protein